RYQNSLVSCPRNKLAFRPAVAGSVGCFSRRERRPYLNRYVRSESRGRGTEKQPTGRGPEGCDENGPAAVPRLRDRLRINLDMRPPRALPTAHFDRNERYAYFGDRTPKSFAQLTACRARDSGIAHASMFTISTCREAVSVGNSVEWPIFLPRSACPIAV